MGSKLQRFHLTVTPPLFLPPLYKKSFHTHVVRTTYFDSRSYIDVICTKLTHLWFVETKRPQHVSQATEQIPVSVVSGIMMVYILSISTNHLFLPSSLQIVSTSGLNKVSNISSAVLVSSVCSVCTLS